MSNYQRYDTSVKSTTASTHCSPKISVISQLPPVPVAVHVPIETLLDYDNAARKVAVCCSKYSEIGNPHARKARIPAERKWNRLASYVSYSGQLSDKHDSRLNFMDKQSSSIYNSIETARIDKQLSDRQVTRITKQQRIRKKKRNNFLPPLVDRRRYADAVLQNVYTMHYHIHYRMILFTNKISRKTLQALYGAQLHRL